MKSISESLAGRCVLLDLNGFSLFELSQKREKYDWVQIWLENPDFFIKREKSRIDLKIPFFEQIWKGFMPKLHFLDNEFKGDYFEAYQRTYIERDVRQILNISENRLFSRFIGLLAAMTGQEINCSELGRDLGLKPQTAKSWLNTMTATFQWIELPAFTMNPEKRISGKPKGYLTDTGYACWLLAISSSRSLSSHPLLGAIFESAGVG